MSGYRLSRRAEKSLRNILAYTVRTFGEAQADKYGAALMRRLDSLAKGRPPRGRPCSVLVKGEAAERLLYVKEGGHFIVYFEAEKEVLVVDFIHEMRDLPTLIRELSADER